VDPLASLSEPGGAGMFAQQTYGSKEPAGVWGGTPVTKFQRGTPYHYDGPLLLNLNLNYEKLQGQS